MKFHFKLQKVLEHRKILEDLAMKDLQEAVAALLGEKEKLEMLKTGRHEAFQRRYDIQTKDLRSEGLLSMQQIEIFIKGQDRRIELQKAKVQEAENLVESMREILRQKATEYKIIDKLKEKQKAEFIEEKNRIEQKEIDELNVIRFGLKENL